MRYLRLGRSGLRVSRICLGTVNFGPLVSAADAHRLLDRALDAGVNFVDTANSYGYEAGSGLSESILGSWFAGGGGRRERTVLATKVFEPVRADPNARGSSALAIRRELDASLRRLRTDHVELYQFHHVDRATPFDEMWQAIEVAVEQGKVLYAGSSNYAGWHLAAAQAAASRRGLSGLVSEQSLYNLIVRDIERDVVPAARTLGIGILAWSPLHEGALAGATTGSDGAVRRLRGRAADARRERGPQLDCFEQLAHRLGQTPAELALAWVLHQPGVTAAIAGARTAHQLDSALRAEQLDLEAEIVSQLGAVFGGPAPTIGACG